MDLVFIFSKPLILQVKKKKTEECRSHYKSLHQLTEKKEVGFRFCESSPSVFSMWVAHVHKPLRMHMQNENKEKNKKKTSGEEEERKWPRTTIKGLAGNWRTGENSVRKANAAWRNRRCFHETAFRIKQQHAFQAFECILLNCTIASPPAFWITTDDCIGSRCSNVSLNCVYLRWDAVGNQPRNVGFPEKLYCESQRDLWIITHSKQIELWNRARKLLGRESQRHTSKYVSDCVVASSLQNHALLENYNERLSSKKNCFTTSGMGHGGYRQ